MLTKFGAYDMLQYLMLLIQCLFLQLIHQPTYALNKIQFITSIKLIHVSALGCHPQGVFWNKEIEVQHTNLGSASPLVE